MPDNYSDPNDFSKSFRIVGFLKFHEPTSILMQNMVSTLPPDETFIWLWKYQMKFYLYNN